MAMSVRRFVLLLGVVVASGLFGCSGVAIHTKPPTLQRDTIFSAGKVAAAQALVNSKMNADRQRLIDRNEVPRLITESVLNSLSAAGQYDPSGAFRLQVLIKNMTIPNFGPARATLIFNVIDANNTLVKSVEANSTSVRGGRTAARMTRVLSDATQKGLNGL